MNLKLLLKVQSIFKKVTMVHFLLYEFYSNFKKKDRVDPMVEREVNI